jgi:hypothetical protein
MDMYDWVEFAGDRARFCGGIRGWDELGHETFCVELNGKSWYGEIEKIFTREADGFGTEILSFGYKQLADVGMPASARVAFLASDIEKLRASVTRLIDIVSQCDNPPFVLSRGKTSRFSGNVAFRDGWVSECKK